MKKIIIILLGLFVLTSCGNNEEEKNNQSIVEKKNISQIVNETGNQTITSNSSDKVKNVTKKEDLEKESIDNTKHFDKYDLKCGDYKTEEAKKYCWETKIKSHLFYLFRGLEGDEIYKIKCSEVFSEKKWKEIPELAKEYVGKCEKVMKPHYEIYKKKLEEKKKEEKIEKQSNNFKLGYCGSIIKEKYSKKSNEEQNKLLEKCRIGFVVKNEKDCSILGNILETEKCEKIKKDISEYKEFIRKQENYNNYGNFDFKNFIKGDINRREKFGFPF